MCARLPPWPLGPYKHVDQRFRIRVRISASFQMLMRTRPAAVAEILLAAIIEDSPEEEYGSRTSIEDDLGLAYDHDGYPTAYWKSPFFAFLQINKDAALSGLH